MRTKPIVTLWLVLGLMLAIRPAPAESPAHETPLRVYELSASDGVGLDGLLPGHRYFKTAADAPLGADAVTPVAAGFVRGGFRAGDDWIGPMEEGNAIAFFSPALELQWKLADDLLLMRCLYDNIRSTEDALYFGLEREISGEWVPSLMKLSLNGRLLWQYNGEPELRPNAYCLFPGGEALIAGERQPTWPDGGKKPDTEGVLLMLDPHGAPMWQRTYAGDGIARFDDVYPAGEGFAAAVKKLDGNYAVHFMRMDGSTQSSVNFADGSETTGSASFCQTGGGLAVCLREWRDEGVAETRVCYASLDGYLPWTATAALSAPAPSSAPDVEKSPLNEVYGRYLNERARMLVKLGDARTWTLEQRADLDQILIDGGWLNNPNGIVEGLPETDEVQMEQARALAAAAVSEKYALSGGAFEGWDAEYAFFRTPEFGAWYVTFLPPDRAEVQPYDLYRAQLYAGSGEVYYTGREMVDDRVLDGGEEEAPLLPLPTELSREAAVRVARDALLEAFGEARGLTADILRAFTPALVLEPDAGEGRFWRIFLAAGDAVLSQSFGSFEAVLSAETGEVLSLEITNG